MPNPNSTENIKDCDAAKISAFILAIEKSGEFERKAYFPVDEKSHFERFNYVEKQSRNKVSVVFDTKAKMLSVTAASELSAKLKKWFENGVPAPQPQPQQSKPVPQPQPQPQQKTEPKPQPKPEPKPQQKPAAQPQQKNQPKPQQKPQPQPKPQKQAHKKPEQPAQKSVKAEISADEAANLEYKNGFIVKNYTPERFTKALSRIKDIKGLNVKKEKVTGQSDLQAYKIEDAKKQKLYVRYMQNKQTVQLQGKESELFINIQSLISESADYKTAVSSYIKQSGEGVTTSEIEKKLKKLIPAAFEFLSEQSKKDLTFALIDIYNEETRLSDYAGLMVSPYRGLERLIYDLQMSQGINVKMIGQAFEKQPSGTYRLKGGYRKKIQSNVYNTVLSALYTEYFEKRNFYLHSDNSELGAQRIIREKDEAKKIFDNLLEIINYYCFMLKEIGFTVIKEK